MNDAVLPYMDLSWCMLEAPIFILIHWATGKSQVTL
jgi:hypothetical protein